MTWSRLRALLFLGGLAAAAALPLAGRALRPAAGPLCALDGVAIPASTRVALLDGAGVGREFCCVDCAVLWIRRTGERPRAITVTDETSGASLPAAEAWFVESRVPSSEVTGCHVHVFAREEDARGHARAFGGRVEPERGGPLGR